ncbi:ring-opening amidohydrolase [Paenibacillus humicola]|uniref:cyanuric acid amidohydrolase n=1 Tax=Paenibacillus humicola TaxID=3110540 RepID=UPI00237BFD9D|nr:ring-opening amidohydrolase [Paenibacillus humicola]
MAMTIGVHKVAMDSPGDTSGLEALIRSGEVDPGALIACIGKTEGNGGANDFTRRLASLSFQLMLSAYIGKERSEAIVFVWSGGTEGVLSPHATFFTRVDDDSVEPVPGEPGLAVSVQNTPDIPAEHIGRMPMVREVAKAVGKAMEDAGVSGPEQVHYVQVKGPLLTPAHLREAAAGGKELVTRDPNLSKGFARGAMALGVALALGEVQEERLSDEAINRDLSLCSGVASTSAGGEMTNCEIILMANTGKGRGPYAIGHAALKDAVDASGVYAAMKDAGLAFKQAPPAELQRQVAAVFAKAEASPDIRGWRTTMLSDADIHYERHARAAAGAVITSVVGSPAVFVSGGTEHQCPPGFAPIACIVRRGGA